jgi:hypothetical protein
MGDERPVVDRCQEAAVTLHSRKAPTPPIPSPSLNVTKSAVVTAEAHGKNP